MESFVYVEITSLKIGEAAAEASKLVVIVLGIDKRVLGFGF